MLRKSVLAFVVAASSAALLLAGCRDRSPAPETDTRIDALFARFDCPDSPGCSVGVSRNGQIVYERGYGTANLELGVPLTPASVFQAASISKQFTALSIMLLAEQGRLSLEDDVRRHLPEMPDYGSPVRVRHLLNHTSGLRDAFLILELSAPEDTYGDHNAVILKQLARQRSLNYAPGSESYYNNGGYILAAIIVQRASGKPLAAFAREHIFAPLGMTSTRFQDDPSVLIPNRASNYARRDDGWLFVPFGVQPGAVGNSGLWTTAADLLRWAHNLAEPKVGSAALLAQMQEPSGVNGADGATWGLGFEIANNHGTTFVGHGGGHTGIDNYFAWYPEHRLAVAVLCNTDNAGSRDLTQQIADLYLPKPETGSREPAITGTPRLEVRSLKPEELESKAGLYREKGGDTFVRAFVRDGELRAALGTGTGESFVITAVSDSRFVIGNTEFGFEFSPSGTTRARELRSFAGTAQTGDFARVEPPALSSAQLREYAGVYTSDELATDWTISARGAGLLIERPGNGDSQVEPIDADTFTTIGDFMRFTRDSRGRVDGFTLTSTTVRSLSFRRARR